MAVMLFSLPANAQFESIMAEANPVYSQDSGIVRYWKNNIFISCNKDSQKGRVVFSMIENNNPVITVAYDNAQFDRVTDIQILDDYLYFCGSVVGNFINSSIIGRFDIPGMFGGLITYELFDVGHPLDLQKMVVYDSQNPHIVAIGNMLTNNRKEGVLVECYYDNASQSYTGLNYYYPIGTSFPSFEDIVLTDSYVVVVADYGNLCLYRCPLNDIRMGITGTEYHYYTQYNEPMESVVATNLFNDNIATSCFAYDRAASEWSNNVRVFDINSMLMVNSQAINVNNKGWASDIVYFPVQNTLIVSHYQGAPNYGYPNTELVPLYPFDTNSYSTNRIIIPNHTWEFTNIDKLQNNFLISIYGSKWFVKDISSPIDLTGSGCYEAYKEMISNIPNVQFTTTPSPYVNTTLTPTQDRNMRSIINCNLNINCLKY